MPTFKLISHVLCPFVQRSAITLEAKGVPYERSDIDLANKPDWFLELSPTGKVPMLVVEDEGRETVIFESAVINEYLDEVTEGSMLPRDPLAKAQLRAMIELASAALGEAWGMGMAKTREDAEAKAKSLRAKLERFEAQIVGPWFGGESMNLVDTATIPLLQRVAWTQDLAPDLGLFEGLPKTQAWLEAAQANEAVRKSMVSDAAEQWHEYLRGSSGWLGAA